MSTRQKITAGVAFILVAAGLGTGVGLTAGDRKPLPGAVDPPPRAEARPPRQEAPDPDREKALQLNLDRLIRHQKELHEQAEILRAKLTTLQPAEPNPHVVRAMGEVLVQVELSIFHTEMDARDAEYKLGELRDKSKVRRWRTAPAMEHLEKNASPEQRAVLDAIAAKEREIKQLMGLQPADSPQLAAAKAELGRLQAEYGLLLQKVMHQLAEQKAAMVEQQIEVTEALKKEKTAALEALKKRREELVRGLENPAGRDRAGEVQRLTAQLQQVEEQSHQIGHAIMAMELRMKGMPEPPADGASSDEKLNRILKELAELRGEVRRLGEPRK